MNIEITPQITEIVNRLATLYRTNLDDSKASGNLQNFETHITINEGKFLITFELADYWKYVEYGRGPGKQPPIEAIEEWIRVKPIIPTAQSNKIPDTRQLAYLIARKIGREGTPAQKPLSRTMWSDDANSLISSIKQEIVDQIIKYIGQDENSQNT